MTEAAKNITKVNLELEGKVLEPMQSNVILVNHIFQTDGFATFEIFVKNIFLIIFGSILLTISSKIQVPVPFWPVPMTMQTFVVFLIGAAYGWQLAGLTLFAYLVEGALGLPVFAKGGGLAYLIGPTAGYLYGMFLAAITIGFLSQKGYASSYILCFFSIILGTIIIFLLGVGYVGSIIGYDKAIAAGLTPFIPSEIFKIALAVTLIPSIYKSFK